MTGTAFNLLGIGLLFVFISCIIFVVFGQVTVRKLRKNPEVKNELGFEFVSGWDIVNVAHTLSMPLWLSDKLQEGPLAFMEANHRAIRKHVNKFDIVLARAFCFFLYASQMILIPIAVMDGIGFFDG